MNVLSLFDGIASGRQALKELGIPVEKYYASEIDKYAISVTQYNFPDTIQLGDIEKWREWDIDWASIDLIQGGFPCQAWSTAGKQKGDEDPRGALVHTLIKIWKHIERHNPDVKYLFENVRMKKEFLDYIDNLFGVPHIKINSSLVSSQNRLRCYWQNIGEIQQPEDRGILLKDILEDKIDAQGEGLDITSPNSKTRRGQLMKHKSNYLTANNHNLGIVQRCIQVGEANLKGHDILKRVYSPLGKSNTVTAGGGGNKVQTNKDDPRADIRGGKLLHKLGNVINPMGTGDKGTELHWRKLTPLECERLQTLPDQFTALGVNEKGEVVKISNSQRYKALGNGWTVEVIKHILKTINK